MISRQGTLAALIAAVGNLRHGGPQKAHLKWSLSSVLDLAVGFSGDGAVNMPTCQHQFSSHIMKEHQITSSIRDLLRFTNHKKKEKIDISPANPCGNNPRVRRSEMFCRRTLRHIAGAQYIVTSLSVEDDMWSAINDLSKQNEFFTIYSITYLVGGLEHVLFFPYIYMGIVIPTG